MATPADQRLLELLDKWLASLELHSRYAALDREAYARVQPWPEHQRPSRWIIDLARQKALMLQNRVQERVAQDDRTFSDSLELMAFLANLVGSEHIERFIPLADPANERAAPPPTSDISAGSGPGASAAHSAAETREMPQLRSPKARPPAAIGTVPVAGPARRAKSPPSARPGDAGVSTAVREQVIADAVRLVQWGRKWYELSELIASMADRPHLTDVRRILKDNKELIEQKAGRG